MKIKDHFLSGEEFELRETEIEGVLKTYPIPDDIEKYYMSDRYISHNQGSFSFKKILFKLFQKLNSRYKQELLDYLLDRKSKVLDYGFGVGEFLKYIEKDFTTFGYEPNEKARNIASKKLKRTKIISSIEEIENGNLDAITLWHVFEHIENQKEVIAQFLSKLRKNGFLIIAVPNYKSVDAEYYKEHWAAYDVPRHIYHFSREGMINTFERKDWRFINTKPLLMDSFYISMLSERYKKSDKIFLRMLISGLNSNLKALESNEFSSLIYVFQKR